MQIQIWCDGCNSVMDEEEKMFCQGCLDEKDTEISDLKEKVGELEEQIEKLIKEQN